MHYDDIRAVGIRLVFCTYVSFAVALPGRAEEGSAVDVISFVTVAMDASEKSYFADTQIPLTLKEFAPPAGLIGVAALQDAESLVFTSLPARWDGRWHPAPRRQFVFLLTGTIEIEVGDSTRRRFSDGDIILLEDTAGRGHYSRVIGETPVSMAIVGLPPLSAEK